jgi:hypothetical protein
MKKIFIILTLLVILPIHSESQTFDYFEIKSDPEKYLGKVYKVNLKKMQKISFTAPGLDFKYTTSADTIDNIKSEGDLLIIRDKDIAKFLLKTSSDCYNKPSNFSLTNVVAKLKVEKPLKVDAQGKIFYYQVFEILEIIEINCSYP